MAAPSSSMLAADPSRQSREMAGPNFSMFAADPFQQAAASAVAAPAGMTGASGVLPAQQVALTTLPVPVTEMSPHQGGYMVAPTDPQGTTVMSPGMQVATMVAPMPLQAAPMTMIAPLLMQTQPAMASQAPQGGPVMAPLPFPAGCPSMRVLQPPQDVHVMAPLPLHDVPPPMMALQPPQAGPMMAHPPLPAGPSLLKRQRPDYFDMPYVPHMIERDQEMAGFDETMTSPYGTYLHNKMPSFGSYAPLLPPDASNTLYVDGLPSNCTRQELTHIFRPYAGFCNVRLVNKGFDSRHAISFVDFATTAQAFSAMEALQGYVFDIHDKHSQSLHLEFSCYPGPCSSDWPCGFARSTDEA